MATAGDVVAAIRGLIAQAQSGRAPLEGLIAPGSWNPQDSTVQVKVGVDGTLDDGSDPDAMVLIPKPVPLLNTSMNAQGGPVGLERVVLLPFEGGPVALLMHNSDSSAGVPDGEYHVYLRLPTGAFGNFDPLSFSKVQNDATRVGHRLKTAILSPIVVLGAEDPDSALAIVRLADLQSAIDTLTQNVQSAIDALARIVQPGAGVTPPTMAETHAGASAISYTA